MTPSERRKTSYAPREKRRSTAEKPLSTYVVVKSTYVDHRIYVHRLYDHVRGRRIRRSRGQLFFGWMPRSPVLVCSRVTAGADSVAVGSGGLCEMRKKVFLWRVNRLLTL